MKSYVKQEVLPGRTQKGQAAHDLFNFIFKCNKEIEKMTKNMLVFNMSYMVE